MDPTKSVDPKFRTLKIKNAKLQQRLLGINYIRLELLPSIGFAEKMSPDNEPVLVVDLIDAGICDHLLQAMATATSSFAATNTTEATVPASASTKQPAATEQLSEKQKARRLMEEKERREKELAKAERKRNLALLKQDKITRETDPNWKPGLSAACAKSGTSISTFRDKYGEN